ncbi:uncharacterized protein LOC134459031 isoform X2 [Engraulis encrasicolus]|uniref:uncharacterized protein LOC134459031 isoform X2 n=1 Tax=Engraulis encrasicolus TaxID=184585 RepID=UPI002FD6989B
MDSCLLRGWNAIDVSDSDVQTVAKTAVKRFMPFFKLVEVRSAEKQIVAGTNFKLDVTVELSMFGEKWGCEFSLFETLQGALYLRENKCVQAN